MNNPYSFPLQSVLDVRCAERQRRRAELADAFRRDSALQAREERIHLAVADQQRDARKTSRGASFDPVAAAEAAQYRDSLQRQLQQLDAERKLLAEEIEWRRDALVEADRGVRVLERLRERRQNEARRERRRQVAVEFHESLAAPRDDEAS